MIGKLMAAYRRWRNRDRVAKRLTALSRPPGPTLLDFDRIIEAEKQMARIRNENSPSESAVHQENEGRVADQRYDQAPPIFRTGQPKPA